jgi:hypothetical protein
MDNKKLVMLSAYSSRERVHVPLSGEPSCVKQEFLKEVNINEIISRMRRGISPPLWMTSNTPRYGDFTTLPTSFQEAYAVMETAEAAFRSLPLEFRRALDHDPRNLDHAPRELYERFGLLKEPATRSSAAPEEPASPTGGKDGDRRPKAPSGANKAVQKPADDADK